MKYIVGNWKAQLTPSLCKSLAQELTKLNFTKNHVWVAPPVTSISEVIEALRGTDIKVGAQNVWPKSGAFTGETTLATLKELGAHFSLVGHSERRHVFGETNELTTERCIGALEEQLPIIFCVGETLAEREANKTNKVIEAQLGSLLSKASPSLQKNLIIAYEPVWAIGTGKVASLEQIAEVHQFISSMTNNIFPILYGGSVTPENFGSILEVPHVDGGLIGGASLKAQSFGNLVDIASS